MLDRQRAQRALALFSALVIVASACTSPPAATTSGPGGTPAGTAPGTGSPDGSPGGTGGTVEIFSWWTAGGEADGLEAMFEVFAQEYPEYQIENAAVAGGAGTEARAVLASRLSQGDPPESW